MEIWQIVHVENSTEQYDRSRQVSELIGSVARTGTQRYLSTGSFTGYCNLWRDREGRKEKREGEGPPRGLHYPFLSPFEQRGEEGGEWQGAKREVCMYTAA